MLLLPFAAADGKHYILTVRAGDEVTLPCDYVIPDQALSPQVVLQQLEHQQLMEGHLKTAKEQEQTANIQKDQLCGGSSWCLWG
ncbi:hypothetical protein CgunFtcFv8_006898 [Champsocephalus gunnari]|uniref:Uncharacterized protein n=1 Tax=Champsocephalus gunnari TaxID=52237 RepID=A0AAN8CKH5_CHAGU|nr:hypothetical protein CgunFtcFv8_006898 [Champsocephalus gunnari]